MAMSPMSGSGRRGRRAPMAEINVTPMVDVMVVLLIIFMVTAPLLVTGVPVDLPESKAGALDQEQEPVQISIERTGAIYVDDAAIPPEALAGRLEQIAVSSTEDGGPRIFLRADRGLDFGRVMQLMGELNAAGLRRVALVSTQEGEGG